MSFTLHHGDCLAVMAGMDAASIDAVVCDPPYGLEFMGKSWDKLDGGGGKAWAMQEWHEAWAVEALRVLPPSHYLLAFGGTRTWHRLACALEDAGFEIRDTLMWLYSTGFPKGKACLKPAWEPVILARKPGPMRELGIEECRIETGDNLNGGAYSGGERPSFHAAPHGRLQPSDYTPPAGRWPANLILDEEAAAMLDGQTAGLRGGVSVNRNRDAAADKPASVYGTFKCDTADVTYGDSGGASRFFYCAKASRAERNAGLEGMPKTVVQSVAMGDKAYGTLPYTNDPREMNPQPRQNHHPTVKPIALMRWLVKLVAREGDTVLDPFTGSGTTGVACVEEGRDFIGIERESEYVEIARRRIEAAAAQQRLPV